MSNSDTSPLEGVLRPPAPTQVRSWRTVSASVVLLLALVLSLGVASNAQARKVPLSAAIDWAKFSASTIDGLSYRNTFAGNFDTLVPENEMKMSKLWTSMPVMVGDTVVSSGIDFQTLDAMANYARQSGKKMRGHTLLFCSQDATGDPQWLSLFNALYPTDPTRVDMMRKFLKMYIQTVIRRYDDVVSNWDVTNEFFEDNTPGVANNDGRYRPCTWTNSFGGETLVKDAFRWAREATQDKLYMNETGLEGENDASRFGRAKIAQFRSEGVPVDGIGIQMHLKTSDEAAHTYSILQNYWRTYTSRGISVLISEMDVQYAVPTDGYLATTGQAQQQTAIYLAAAAACRDDPGCTGFGTWGVGDKYSWREPNGIATGPLYKHPLAFTQTWAPKQAWNEIYARLGQ